MTRLTNAARDKIATMILDHKFKASEAALDKRQQALGLEGYNHLYTAAQRRLMAELIATAPKLAVFFTLDQFEANVGGWKVKLKLAARQPVFECHESGWAAILNLDDGSSLGAKIKQYATDRKEHDAERAKLGQQVTAQLRPHFTFERLVEAWPEIERFVSAVERGLAAPVSAPALVDHKALNAALDLPPELAKAA